MICSSGETGQTLKTLLALRTLESTRGKSAHVTDAAFSLQILNTAGTVITENACLNGVPEALKALFSPLDQLLDTDFADRCPEGAKPLKMQQSSPTVHAETRSVLALDYPDGVYTDTFPGREREHERLTRRGYINNMLCPRCMGNLSLFGINTIVMPDTVLDKGWAGHRRPYVDLSLTIARAGGIGLYMIDEGTGEPSEKPNAVTFEAGTGKDHFENFELHEVPRSDEEAMSLIRAHDRKNQVYNPLCAYTCGIRLRRGEKTVFALCTQTLVPGITPDIYKRNYSGRETKYSLVTPPVTSLLMLARRYGYRFEDKTLYSSAVPVMRDMINAAAAGLTRFVFDPGMESRDFQTLLEQNKDHVRQARHSTNGQAYTVYSQYAALHNIGKVMDFVTVT